MTNVKEEGRVKQQRERERSKTQTKNCESRWKEHRFLKAIPSPSSLMDLGSDTAKHCMVSYFCCDASCWSDVGRASPSANGLISMRQLKVWLFRAEASLLRWLTAREERGRRDRSQRTGRGPETKTGTVGGV